MLRDDVRQLSYWMWRTELQKDLLWMSALDSAARQQNTTSEEFLNLAAGSLRGPLLRESTMGAHNMWAAYQPRRFRDFQDQVLIVLTRNEDVTALPLIRALARYEFRKD